MSIKLRKDSPEMWGLYENKIPVRARQIQEGEVISDDVFVLFAHRAAGHPRPGDYLVCPTIGLPGVPPVVTLVPKALFTSQYLPMVDSE